MGLFKKKPKLTEEEKEAKYDAVEARMVKSIKNLEGLKKQYFAGLMQARAKKLPAQEKAYRASLSRCIAQIHMQEGALMNLQLTRQNKEFAGCAKDFVDSIMMISEDIMTSTKGVNVKKVEDSMLKSKMYLEQQEKNMDEILEVGRYNEIESADSARYAEYDAEIDGMIEASEGPAYNSVNNYNKERY